MLTFLRNRPWVAVSFPIPVSMCKYKKLNFYDSWWCMIASPKAADDSTLSHACTGMPEWLIEPSAPFSFPHRITFLFCFVFFFTTVMVSHLCFLSTRRATLPYLPLQWAEVQCRAETPFLAHVNPVVPVPSVKVFILLPSPFGYTAGPSLSCPCISAWPFANTTVLVSVARECTSKSGWRFYTTLNNKKPQSF